MITGFCFFAFAVFSLLSQPFGNVTRWRGIAAAVVGAMLTIILIFGSSTFLNQPAKELWNLYSFRYDDLSTTWGQKYGLRQVFPRVPDHPLLAGLTNEHFRDWRGESTTMPAQL